MSIRAGFAHDCSIDRQESIFDAWPSVHSQTVATPVSSTARADVRCHSDVIRVTEWGLGGDVWRDIFDDMPSAGPFLSPAWTSAWITVFAPSLQPMQVVVSDETGRPIGTCLLTASAQTAGSYAPHRGCLNTDGEAAADTVVIEHNALLCREGSSAVVADAVAAFVKSTDFDEFRASGVGEEEVARLRSAFGDWIGDVEWKASPYVDVARLRREGTTHLDSVSANTRAQIRRSLREYDRRGAVVLEQAGTSDEAESMLVEMIQLHERRWKGRARAGAFDSINRRRFHSEFVRHAVPAGYAHLLRVRAGADTIGILYCLVANGRVNFYQSGFCYESDPRLKPGLVTHHVAIEHYLRQGISEYDFLVSGAGEGRYKKSLATDSRRLGWMVLARPGLRYKVFRIARFLRRMFRRLVAVRTRPERP